MRGTFLAQKDNKNSLLKKMILRLCINDGEYSISDLSQQLNASVPTVTKLIGELMDEGFMVDLGKQGTSGGRRPSIYGLNPDAGYFVGLDISRHHVTMAVTDFKGGVLAYESDIEFTMEPNEKACHQIARSLFRYFNGKGLDWGQVLGCGVSFTGRVNPETGYSFSYSFAPDRPINVILQEVLGVPVNVENDSRAMTFGEYIAGGVKKAQNMLFINVSWGLGMGMILDGKLVYGKSGYSGEIGHFPLMNNDIICRCGKVGCFETGASGSALYRIFMERLKAGKASSLSAKYRQGESITLEDILRAVRKEDVLAIEVIEEIGATLGRGLAGLINIFNPEVVIIGGKLVAGGDYLMLNVRSTVKKLAQNLVNQDTSIQFSQLGGEAAVIGDCMLSRSKLLGVL